MLNLSSNLLYSAMFIGYFIGLLFALLFNKRDNYANYFSFGASTVGGILGILAALDVLLTGIPYRTGMPTSIPYLRIEILFDGLSAFFLLVISILVTAVSIFSLGYAKGYFGRYNIGRLGVLYNLFIISMILVVGANNGFFFLMCWELMSLLSYLLVVFEYREPENSRAGFIYILMTHAGTALIILAFLILFLSYGTFDFDQYRIMVGSMDTRTTSLVFLLTLIGFGMKAGIIPLHVWLPRAHPAAPSNVSALMSGVMIKTGIYALFRFVFDFLAVGQSWWGLLVLIIASGSAVLGVMYALMEHDIKRLLAFHSVENIGIILLGIGASMMLSFYGHDDIAALAAMAGLYHVMNHAMFKGLLFLGAGSVVYSTHTQNIEKLGGLIKKMPYTAFFFLVGSVSISALPPFNGFISEWLTFMSLLLGVGVSEQTVRVLLPVFIGLLAITGALAAACFVKAFGVTFLAMPRSDRAADAEEVPFTMKTGMAILALMCLVLGVFPAQVISILDSVVSGYFGGSIIDKVILNPFTVVPAVQGFSVYAPLPLFLVMVLLILMPLAILRLVFGPDCTRIGPTWDCGIPRVGPRMEYTASGFSKPLNIIFRSIYRPTEDLEVSRITPYFKRSIHFETSIEDVFEKYLYGPISPGMLSMAKRVSRIQTGSIHAYLTYMFATLVIVLFIGGRSL